MQEQNSKNFRPYPHWEGDTPSQTYPLNAFGVSSFPLEISGYAPG